MSESAAPRVARTTPAWLRATMTQALWCWLTVALALGVSRAVVALGSDLAPLPFAAYSILIFVVIPAVPGLVTIAVVAGAQRAAAPWWAQVLVVALALGGWAFFATTSPGWGLGYALAGAIAAAITVAARSRESVWSRALVTIVGAVLLGLAWFGLETFG
ncbi:hypothetical protein [Pseudactinotalea terrae]|uniref:hypothetical protein n=1 Tax=Pseudactinotalea terrae TaxID=1743262 RepID=UPI0012E21037|nr:hypothetical protein [Pseudactinotalea terrae]